MQPSCKSRQRNPLMRQSIENVEVPHAQAEEHSNAAFVFAPLLRALQIHGHLEFLLKGGWQILDFRRDNMVSVRSGPSRRIENRRAFFQVDTSIVSTWRNRWTLLVPQ